MRYLSKSMWVASTMLAGCFAVGGTRQWTDRACVPPFELTSGEPVDIYEVDWFDRDDVYTKFDYPTDEFLLCVQPTGVADTWCERRALVYSRGEATPSSSIRVRKLPPGSVVRFDGSVTRTRNWGIENVSGGPSPWSYFRGEVGGTTVWLPGVDLLHLMRDAPDASTEFRAALDAIGAPGMLELYLSGDDEVYGSWRCTRDAASSS